MNQTELKAIVASKDKIKKLLEMKSSLPTLVTIMSMDPVDEELLNLAKTVGGKYFIHVSGIDYFG